MISIAIPTYNPNINEFKEAVKSALATTCTEIIIVDDCSDKSNTEYFNYLSELGNNDRIKLIYNEENKGRFMNSFFAVCQATNKYVKKLDADDILVPHEFDRVNEIDHEVDIIFTRYYYKEKLKNKNKHKKWNLFNGSVIYKTSSLSDLNIESTPKNFFGDIIFISHVLSKPDAVSSFLNHAPYKYKIINSTTPSKLLEKYDDWLKGYNWILENTKMDDEILFTIEKQIIFYELMMIKKKQKYSKSKFKYFKSWNFCPGFIKSIVAYFTFKF